MLYNRERAELARLIAQAIEASEEHRNLVYWADVFPDKSAASIAQAILDALPKLDIPPSWSR
jgi:hypothetical protein